MEIIKDAGNRNSYTWKGLTLGKLQAIETALQQRVEHDPNGSSVSQELLAMVSGIGAGEQSGRRRR